MDYTTEEQAQALIQPDTRTQLQKDLHRMVQANCEPALCGTDENQALERVALQLLHLAQSGSPWITVDVKPPAEMAVLVSNGHSALRAMWVPEQSKEVGVGDFEGEVDFSEDGTAYWPEGWYEWNHQDECHWQLTGDDTPTHWAFLPKAPRA
jgi:Ni,Fe-hydrogenase III component G